MKSSTDSMVFRLKDTYGFLDTYLDKTGNQILVEAGDMSEFLIRAFMILLCNQSAIMTYFLEKEGHPGLPGVADIKKEET
jgi:hypothetical protein